MANVIGYQPKGSMCVVCKKRDKDCSQLPFSLMPIIEKQKHILIVRCYEFDHRGV